jgi:hypothetical protein
MLDQFIAILLNICAKSNTNHYIKVEDNRKKLKALYVPLIRTHNLPQGSTKEDITDD